MNMPMQFLECEAQKKVKELKPIFDRAVKKAKQIAEEAGVAFYDIVQVRFYTSDEEKNEGAAGKWTPDDKAETAVIAFSRNADPEALTHEVAHSFFHGSPLHDSNNEHRKYGEKFCNAFRYALHADKSKSWMETESGPYDAHALVEKLEKRAKCKKVDLLAALTEYFVELCKKKGSKMCARILDSEGL